MGGGDQTWCKELQMPVDANVFMFLQIQILTQATTMMETLLETYQKIWCIRNYEDAEMILNNGMLLNGLMIAFSQTLVSGTFQHEDFTEGDARNLERFRQEQGIADDSEDIPSGKTWMGNEVIISRKFLEIGNICTFLFLISLTICASLSISVALIGGRSDKRAFKIWSRYLTWLILVSYGILLAGVSMFFRLTEIIVDMIYPRYPMDLAGIYNTMDRAMNSLVFSGGSYHSDTDDPLNTAQMIVTPIIFSVAILVIPIMVYLQLKSEDSKELASRSDQVTPQNPGNDNLRIPHSSPSVAQYPHAPVASARNFSMTHESPIPGSPGVQVSRYCPIEATFHFQKVFNSYVSVYEHGVKRL